MNSLSPSLLIHARLSMGLSRLSFEFALISLFNAESCLIARVSTRYLHKAVLSYRGKELTNRERQRIFD